METRKLQRTGGSSLIVTLPKKWVEQNNLQDKDLVKIYSSDLNTLQLKPFNKQKIFQKSILNINPLSKNMLIRELIAHYISGVDEIIIQSDRISPEKRNSIRSLSNFLIGFEIIDETSEKIILRNIFDPSKFPITKNIEKMFLVTISMFQDALKALINDDKTLANDVVERDFEIDKLHLMTKRQRHSLTMNIISEEEIGLNPDELHYYENVATQLERIADHAVKISRIVNSLDKNFAKVVDMNQFNAFAEKIKIRLEDAKNMVKNIDKNAAHKILDSEPDIEHIRFSISKNQKDSSFITNLIEDSFDRVRGYTMNLAEITIDHAVTRENK